MMTEIATLLIVDDIEANINLMLGILDDYDVIPATSGEDALAVIDKEDIDLVLMDIMMPGMDGYELCRRLKAHSKTAEVPVIFITAQDNPKSIEQAYAAGGYDYITKPVHAIELLARVKTQLQLHQQYEQLKQQNRAIDKASKALAESEERYRLAMDAITHGLWDWDILSGNVYYSPAWCRILGESCTTNNYATWESRIHPDDKARVIKSLRAHLDSQSGDWSAEHRLRHKDGRWVWVMGTGQIVQRDNHGQPTRMVGTMFDITERKQHQALLELRHQLAEQVHTDDPQRILRISLETAEKLTDSQFSFFVFIDQDQNRLPWQVWSPKTQAFPGHFTDGQQHEDISMAGIWADCLRQRQAVIHNDYAVLEQNKGLPNTHTPLQRELTVPVFREGQATAVMGVGNKPRPYDESDTSIVQQIAEMAQDLVDRKRMEERIEYMAFNDSLTGLPNRALMMDRLKQAISSCERTGHLLAVCYIDLDGFKPVNDRFGHHAGDALLIDLAKRLSNELREGDTLARLGGDEFIMLFNDLEGIQNGEKILKRALQTIARPFEIEGESVSVTASIGATFYPSDDADSHTLLRHADEAMYEAKHAGKSTFCVYQPLGASVTS